MTVKMISVAAMMMVSSFASQAAQVQFTVEANVPDDSFYVRGTGWESATQRMSWNEAALSLTPIERDLKMKNSSGSIKAYLQEAAMLSSGTNADPIPLTIKVFNQTLPVGAAGAVEVLSAADGRTEKNRVMSVSQTAAYTAANRPVGGQYRGAITMMFDSVPATTAQ
ncbi:CS1 type fimbrial major subunit [Providencia alcalifaciens]|uniref:CS1 type fimbrial major subunit n=1 Tax=Providencia alcalifaciens TaxID=126385 RepID=A0A4R3NFD4_9GAMM|nr:CS1 type fimbrial major subunit [Providencia alcalifaciens]MBC5792358.1 fimbrial assembly protein [Providencia sp. JUb39]TCT28194.1 CS1 type fimbrial major subunit [Providencia alcalifaciens]